MKKCEQCKSELPKGMKHMCYDCYNEMYFGGCDIMTTKEWISGVGRAIFYFALIIFITYLIFK